MKRMSGMTNTMIDWQTMKKKWIDDVKNTLLPKLSRDSRFINSIQLINRFQSEIQVWEKTALFKPLIEIGNELASAEKLLDHLTANDTLTYEPPIIGTNKKIDFLINAASGAYEWIEVKTVAPQWVDDQAGWIRFTQIAQEAPENASFIARREWAGAAISGQAIKARWSFIQRAAEIEARAQSIPKNQSGPISLLFCSTGLAWAKDELEDFADFYRTGAFRADDWLSNATKRYMQDQSLTFDRSIAGFHFLGRKHDEVSANDFSRNISGPILGT